MICLKNGFLNDAVHEEPYKADILIKEGKIFKIGEALEIPEGTKVYDVSGLNVYPGFVEAHCHLGLAGYAIGYEGIDANEYNDIISPQLRAIDSFNPMDPSVRKALAAGVTTAVTGPGSSNVLGGTFFAVKTYGKCADEMVIKDPVAMKCAFGENPKRCYKDKGDSARMTTAAKLREILMKARDYKARQEAAEDALKKPAFDTKLEALIPVLNREIPLKAHAHQANDIFTAIRVAKEFNLKLTLEHCTEGHLIAEELSKYSADIPVAVGPTMCFASKIEVQNKSFETSVILTELGFNVSIITDSPIIPQEYLGLCAGHAVKAGLKPFHALKAITINPAKHAGIEDRVGSIECGKDGDIVVMEGSPFDVSSNVKYVLVNGEIRVQN